MPATPAHPLASPPHRGRFANLDEELQYKHAVLAGSAHAHCVADLDGVCRYLNDAWLELGGLSRDHALGRPIREVLPAELLAPAEEALARDSRATIEREITRRDGEKLWVELAAAPLLDEGGVRIGSSFTVADVTARCRSREEVRELRLKEAAMAAAGSAIAISDAEYRIQYVNDAYLRLFHLDRAAIIGKRVLEVFPDAERVIRGASEASGFVGEDVHRAPDGSLRHVSVTASPILKDDGTLAATVGVMVDVTELRRIEQELAFQNMVLSTQQETALDGILVVDGRGRILSFNQRFVDLCGLPQDVIDSRSDERAIQVVLDQLADPTEFLDRVNYLREHPTESSREEIRFKDGRTIDRYSAPLTSQDGTSHGRVWYFRDITARVEAEQALARRTAELERSNRELEQFAYVASHDLQEPLRMVSSFTQLLADRYQGKLDEDADDFIRFAVSGATRMQRLINDLLLYARVGTRARPSAPVEVQGALGRAMANLALVIEENQALVTNDALPVVSADEAQLVQLFQNLLDNAIKFRRDTPPHIHVSAQRKADVWEFGVKDNGVGFDPAYAPKVFQIFQRLHGKDVAGTGIGLALCKRIVERHGGSIWVESEPGQGTTFHFTLPA